MDPRVLVHATLGTPWGPLRVASTHTSRGVCGAREIAETMRARRGPFPSVLMGDFNTPERHPGLTALTEGAGFIDAFRAANPTALGNTVWQQVYAPRPTVFLRVDYVLVMPGQAVRGRVLGSRVVVDRPGRLPDGRPLWPSDHFGVLADLEVFPQPEAK